MDQKRNAANKPVLSRNGVRVCVRLIHTDEEQIIAKTVCRVLNRGEEKDLQ